MTGLRREEAGWLRQGALLGVLLLLVITGCVQGNDSGAAPTAAPKLAPVSAALAGPGVPGPVCQGTGAHDTHVAQGFACQVCHACGGLTGLTPGQTLPSGLPLTGTMVKTGTTTSCSVTCHQPVGQPATTITWDTKGPLACAACHEQGLPPPGGGSFHPRDDSSPAANRAACQGCHDLSAHVTGIIKIKTPTSVVSFPRGSGGSTAANPACESCHLGHGGTLAGQTPPMLVGWSDTAKGDFHGARAGTGSGGTLYPPYSRGQGPLPCSACHEPHSSGNPFLFAKAANGLIVPAGTIERTGVGAEKLCSACHQGQRHAYCMGCHGGIDPEPAGSACLSCHGHEGIRYIPLPVTPMHGSQGGAGTALACDHCHSLGWAPAPETAAPLISSVTASNILGSNAIIRWVTDENSTSFVEYGPSGPNQVFGSSVLVTGHSVTLTGLSELTSYQFRVRSVDLYRNVAESSISTFVTIDAKTPQAPAGLVPFGLYTDTDPYPVPLSWGAVTSPLGNPVQYQVEVWSTVSGPVATSPWLSVRSWTVPLSPMDPPDNYGWHVRARDVVTGTNSAWSAPSVVNLWWYGYSGG